MRSVRNFQLIEFAGDHLAAAAPPVPCRSSRVSGEETSFGHGAAPVPGAANALHGYRDSAGGLLIWQTRSTLPISMPSSSEAVAIRMLDFAVLQALLGIKSQGAGKRSMVRGNGIGAQTFRKLEAESFRRAAACSRRQGSSGADSQTCASKAIVELGPHGRGGDGAELVARHLDGDVQRYAAGPPGRSWLACSFGMCRSR